MNKYITIGFICTISVLSTIFYLYYSSSQKEIKTLHTNVELLNNQKSELIKDINNQTEMIEKKAQEINLKQEQINELENQKSVIRYENSKLKNKLEKRDFDKIVNSSESRKKKVEDALKDSTYRELSELEELTKKIKTTIERT